MHFRTLVLMAVLFSSVTYGQGRKPAVEDFVGVEIEEHQVAPQGTESLFNLEQDLNKIHENKRVAPAPATISETSSWTMTNFISLAFVLSLPVVIWLLIMAHLKRKASIESASNIEILEKYRKEREKKSEENIKKAS